MESTSALLAPDLSRDPLLARLKALRPAFERAGITRMWLIGSRARSDNRPDSDIDLMVEIDETRKFSLLDLMGVKHIVEDDIGLPADMFERSGLDARFRSFVDADAVRIF